jgi:hypothetical protein
MMMDKNNFHHHRQQSSGDDQIHGAGGFNSSGRNAPIPKDQVIDVLRNLNVFHITAL